MCEIPIDYQQINKTGAIMGSGGLIVMDETTCMVEAARRMTKFFAHESCGRCTPCRIGATRLYEILNRIESGKAVVGDVDRVLELTAGIDGRTFCPMGGALVNPARSAIVHFRDEFDYHVEHKHCMTGV